MSSISARVDVLPDHVSRKDLLQMLSDFTMLYSDKYLVSEEIGEITGKRHFHVYMLLRSGSSFETARKQWKRKFARWDGRRQQKSFAPTKDIPKYLAYIAKDGNLVLRKGIDDSEIGEWVNPKEYGKTAIDMIRKYADDKKEPMETLEDCQKVTFRYYLDSKKTMNKYRMFDTAYSLYCQVEPEQSEQDFLDWCRQK